MTLAQELGHLAVRGLGQEFRHWLAMTHGGGRSDVLCLCGPGGQMHGVRCRHWGREEWSCEPTESRTSGPDADQDNSLI